MPLLPSSEGSVKNIGPGGGSIDDIESFLNADDVDDNKDNKDDKDDKEEKKDDKEIELKEDINEEKIDLKEKDKDNKDDKDDKEEKKDDEVVEIDAPPKKREILAKYPDVFKDFPFLEKMLYRDKQYQELFGSFDDAKEAAEKVEAFEHFESELSVGNTEEILKTIKAEDSKAFDKLVDNYLITLHKVDKDAYFEVVSNVGKRFIAELVKEGDNSGDEDTKSEFKKAALILNQFLFGTSTYTPIKPRTDVQKDDKDQKLESERLAFIQERFETSRNDLQGRVDNILKNTISEYIDPRDVMTPYIKKNAIKDALAELNETLNGDDSLKRNLDKLWKAAFEGKFDKTSLSRIQSAYLGRAKGFLPTVIKKARAEALKDLPSSRRNDKEEVEEKEEKEETSPKRTITTGRPSSHKPKSQMEKGESVLDFLTRD